MVLRKRKSVLDRNREKSVGEACRNEILADQCVVPVVTQLSTISLQINDRDWLDGSFKHFVSVDDIVSSDAAFNLVLCFMLSMEICVTMATYSR